MIIFVDIDGTICNTPDVTDYSKSYPIKENIKIANDLFDKGHTIIYWTARGTVTKKDWRYITEKQLKKWKVKYHELRMGKPYYDLFIDDKNINAKDFCNLPI
jgi:histidinol phosphatase-like enzyme